MQVKIESLLPHRNQEHSVAALAKIFLSALQLDRLLRFLQWTKKWRGRLADLKIDGAVLDLDHHIVVEFPIEFVEIVVGGPRTIVLGIAPVHVMVVNESPVKNETAMRFERSGDNIRSIRVRSPIG